MKTILSESYKSERGNALIIVLCLLVAGGLAIAPLLAHMSTGLKAIQIREAKMYEFYAADAGVEDAIYKITNRYPPLQDLNVNGTHNYYLADSINGLAPATVGITKMSLLAEILDPDEYKINQPHESWASFGVPLLVERTEEYVEYSCNITFKYTGAGQRTLQTLGTFFAPFPGDINLITGPYDIVYTQIFTDDDLEDDNPKSIIGSAGFAFLWRWENNKGPAFDTNDTGAVSFKFKIDDPSWEYSTFFAFATTKEQDISFVSSTPFPYKWLVEAAAAGTDIKSSVFEDSEGLVILTWEIE
jgi:hypothetical protein